MHADIQEEWAVPVKVVHVARTVRVGYGSTTDGGGATGLALVFTNAEGVHLAVVVPDEVAAGLGDTINKHDRSKSRGQ